MSEEDNAGTEFGFKSFQRRGRKFDPLPEALAKRQGLIVHLAFGLLGGRDEAMSFLNTCNDKLGGRPIDLAIANVEGFELVERAIRERSVV